MSTLNRKYVLTEPFQEKGHVIQGILYYDGNSDLVHSWDLAMRGFNISKATRDERLAKGFTDEDVERMNLHVAGIVAAREGRRIY